MPSVDAITDMNIECGYVMLCRAVPFEQINYQSEEYINECLLGFKKEDIVILFNTK